MQIEFKDKVFGIKSKTEFEAVAMAVFQHQVKHNHIYASYIDAIGVLPSSIEKIEDIPFLPIGFFKTHEVITGNFEPEIVFTSSGTSGQQTSKHVVRDLAIYQKSFQLGFESIYGSVKNWCILALLPAYLERSGSSLVYMADAMIGDSAHQKSGFYLNNYEQLIDTLISLAAENTPTLLLGVSFALLDLAEIISPLNHKNLVVMETGGMKGRRKEMIREELHTILKNGFGVDQIHSEYGMTELLSQAYATADGLFKSPPWMRVLLRDTSDPFGVLTQPSSGAINVIDLANLHSCAFIATEDLGRTHPDGSFDVLGRFDNAEIRGCNLMVI